VNALSMMLDSAFPSRLEGMERVFPE